MRIIVEQAVTGTILSRNLPATDIQVIRTLSGPCTIKFNISPEEPEMAGIIFKAYGQIVHAESQKQNGERFIFASGIVQPTEIDEKTGMVSITATGFSNYPDKIPWLQNWNPIAVDPFEVVHKIWDHVQSYAQGNIGVTVSPASSGTLLLPGFYYDGSEFVLDFFAYFVRAEDYRDCLEEITSLCRDVPIDYFEDSAWNAGKTAINKTLRLAYPRGGAQQNNLVFRQRENVMSMTPANELDMDFVSDVIIRSWWPGKMKDVTLSNADPQRFRRVVKDEDALINSRERAQALMGRKLARRQVPQHWSTIVVDMFHPNAPWGSYEVGDDILLQGYMPMYGKMSEWHRIMSIQPDDAKGTVSLSTKHVNAFNYDPITFADTE